MSSNVKLWISDLLHDKNYINNPANQQWVNTLHFKTEMTNFVFPSDLAVIVSHVL